MISMVPILRTLPHAIPKLKTLRPDCIIELVLTNEVPSLPAIQSNFPMKVAGCKLFQLEVKIDWRCCVSCTCMCVLGRTTAVCLRDCRGQKASKNVMGNPPRSP